MRAFKLLLCIDELVVNYNIEYIKKVHDRNSFESFSLYIFFDDSLVYYIYMLIYMNIYAHQYISLVFNCV